MRWCELEDVLWDRETNLTQLRPHFILLTGITFTSVMGVRATWRVLWGQTQTRVQWHKGLFEEQSQIVGCAQPSSSPAGLSPDSRLSFVLLFSLRTSDNYSVWHGLLEKYNKINIHVWGIHKIIIPGLILILSLVGLGSLCFFWPRLETVTLEECLHWEEHTVMCW